MIPTVHPLFHNLNSSGNRGRSLKSKPLLWFPHLIHFFNLILALGKPLFSIWTTEPPPPVTNQFTCITHHVKSCQQSGLTYSHSTPMAAQSGSGEYFMFYLCMRKELDCRIFSNEGGKCKKCCECIDCVRNGRVTRLFSGTAADIIVITSHSIREDISLLWPVTAVCIL